MAGLRFYLDRESDIGEGRIARTSVAPLVKGKLNVQRFLIPYRVYGSGESSLVFINGIQQSMAMWHSFVRRFSDRYRIVLFDFPNQGGGRVIAGSPHLSLDEQVGILKAVINETSDDCQPIVCAASWGGVVALACAVRHPQMIKSLILASIGTKANQKMIDIISEGQRMPVKDRLKIAKKLIESLGPQLPAAMKQRIIGQFQRMDTEALDAFLRHGLTVISVRDLRKVVDLWKVRCKAPEYNFQNRHIEV